MIVVSVSVAGAGLRIYYYRWGIQSVLTTQDALYSVPAPVFFFYEFKQSPSPLYTPSTNKQYDENEVLVKSDHNIISLVIYRSWI